VIEDRYGQVRKFVAGDLPDVQAQLGGKPQTLIVEENWVPTAIAPGISGSWSVTGQGSSLRRSTRCWPTPVSRP
jgi:hypothetical protein